MQKPFPSHIMLSSTFHSMPTPNPSAYASMTTAYHENGYRGNGYGHNGGLDGAYDNDPIPAKLGEKVVDEVIHKDHQNEHREYEGVEPRPTITKGNHITYRKQAALTAIW